MIRTLRVRNLAVIEELELELGPGLTVVTGETGAGKSVLLGAISMLAGRRVTTEVVRAGADSGQVEAILDDPAILERARERGFAEDDETELLVARAVPPEGRGRVRLNGRLSTATMLGEVLGDRVEIVSQGEHQRVLRPEFQAELLDRFAEATELRGEVETRYAAWSELGRRIDEHRASGAERARRADQLRYEIEQIDAVAPEPDELESLEAERGRLAHVDRLAGDTASVLALLDAEGGARESVARARAEIEGAARLDGAGLGPIAEGLERAGLELDEATVALERYGASLDGDPARLEAVERRLAQLERLRTRYGPTLDEVAAYRARAAQELDELGGGASRVEELEREREAVAAQLSDAASRLTKRRESAAAALESAVAEELSALELKGARFWVRLEPLGDAGAPSGRTGRERAAFLLAANPGDDPRRLRNTASGGELSRLLLALRTSLRDQESRAVLLFDEVDAGLGGRTARRVGERLRALATRHQVLCITHLPQVAAFADHQFRVVKRTRSGRRVTAIERVEGSERVDELARMAGGRPTEAARAHARELLADAGRARPGSGDAGS